MGEGSSIVGGPSRSRLTILGKPVGFRPIRGATAEMFQEDAVEILRLPEAPSLKRT